MYIPNIMFPQSQILHDLDLHTKVLHNIVQVEWGQLTLFKIQQSQKIIRAR